MVKNPPAKQETWVQTLVGKIPRRRRCQPTPVFLPGKSHGQRNLVGYRSRKYNCTSHSDHSDNITLQEEPLKKSNVSKSKGKKKKNQVNSIMVLSTIAEFSASRSE